MLDSQYMTLALQMARSMQGQTSPNPLVGAVIVQNGEVVGLGAHLKAGEPHAEVHALAMAQEKSKGATLYVTLEPCSHHGRTPPCADAIIQAGIRRVVIATADPNPLVAGRGVTMLREAGIQVSVGLMENEARKLNEVYFHYMATGLPFVTVKTASTLDGKIATATGHSRWITGIQAREHVHLLRTQHDAILVGIGTVLADNPALTARLGKTTRQPLRVILDSSCQTPVEAKVVQDRTVPTWIFTTGRAPADKQYALTEAGVKVIVTEDTDRVSVSEVLRYLGEQGITSVLVEGGSAVNGAFLEAKAIQKIISYLALKLVGGQLSPTAFGGSGLATMNEAIRLTEIEIERVSEQDLCITGYPVWS